MKVRRISAPFLHAPTSVAATMGLVMAALIPATLFNLYLFGWPAILLFLVTTSACLAVEGACLLVAKKPVLPALHDGSALLSGWLLALSLPPWAPWWIGVLGAVFAIALAKQAFGGLGQNLFNPAMVARVALLISFPQAMTSWVLPHPLFSAGSPDLFSALSITFGGHLPDAVSAASALGYIKTELSRGVSLAQSMAHVPDIIGLSSGYKAGSMGETALLPILAGGIFLLRRKVISWHTPVGLMGALLALGTIFHALEPARYAGGLFQLLSGATFLGAFFIATDYVTSPVSKLGQLIFGIGCGALTWVIRTFAGYPEGMAFAILLMNSLTPIIDQYTRPRPFGRNRQGEPLA